jgi:DNA-binding response OmpR family regulator
LRSPRFLRDRFDVGIIIVTGASDVVDRVAGLEAGADDYVVKPFDPRELRARVKSVLRRMQARGRSRRRNTHQAAGHRRACGWAWVRSTSFPTNFSRPTETKCRLLAWSSICSNYLSNGRIRC